MELRMAKSKSQLSGLAKPRPSPERGYRTSPIKGNVKRNTSSSARCRYFVRHSAQLFERALSIREWSCSGRVAYFVPACEAQERFLFPVVPYLVATAPFVSEISSLTVIHFMIGNAWSYLRLVAYGFLGLSERA